jgi:hydrogenase nickel incorporation protein HypB
LSKADLLPYLPFDLERAKKEALDLNPRLRIFVLSALTGEGLDDFIDFLVDARSALSPADA